MDNMYSSALVLIISSILHILHYIEIVLTKFIWTEYIWGNMKIAAGVGVEPTLFVVALIQNTD